MTLHEKLSTCIQTEANTPSKDPVTKLLVGSCQLPLGTRETGRASMEYGGREMEVRHPLGTECRERE